MSGGLFPGGSALLLNPSAFGAAHHFAIEVDGTITANFKKCSGVSATTHVETWNEGGWNHTPLKFPGRTDFGNIKLSTGMTVNWDLYRWYMEIIAGLWSRKFLSVILMGPYSIELHRWNLLWAFPVKWTGPSLDVDSGSNVAVEEIEIAHEGLLGF